MSNTVTNILTINGTDKQVAKVREFIKGSNNESISFQSIFPMPKNLKGKRNVNYKLGSKTISVPDWMDWRFKHWGTKWDAMPVEDDVVNAPNHIIFNTASTTPDKAIACLAVLFPEVSFHVIFSDECAGEYSGEYTFSGVAEDLKWTCLTDDSDEAMEYYFLTHEYDRANWKKGEDGKWVNICESAENEETAA